MTNRETTAESTKELHESVTEGQAGKSSDSWIKNAALFFASPFIAIAYAMALPFVGFYQFTKLSHEARVRKQKVLAKKARKARKAKKAEKAKRVS
ncbi:MAG: hypothetical protein WBN41_08115 [Lysobacterales bacterium]